MTSRDETNPAELRKIILASTVGTIIEWYDFLVFGSLATVLAAQFFPKTNPTVGNISTLATFATGFLARPFGAMVFGRMGDLLGRKVTFLTTLLTMGFATAAIGILPGYDRIGVLAPIMVLLLRLVQGLAVGGEYGGAATYVAEHCPARRRGYFTGYIQTTGAFGMLMSLAIVLAVRTTIGETAFTAWGWRIPFLLSIVLVFFSYLIRLKMSESPLFAAAKSEGRLSRNPLRECFSNPESRHLILVALFGVMIGQAMLWYTGQFYALNFMETVMKVPGAVATEIVAIAVVIGAPLYVVFGALSDRIGRKPLMVYTCLVAALAYWPLYAAMLKFGGSPSEITPASGPFWILTALVFLQVVLATVAFGPLAAFLVELFPTRIRYTAISLPYHLGFGIFGGLEPLIGAAAIARTGNKLACVWFPIAITAICFILGTIFVKEQRTPEGFAELA